ncbi:MAG: hypothetical protein ACYS47_19995 [Planctomycetota bacterium]
MKLTALVPLVCLMTASAAVSSGCCTIFSGTHETVIVSSEPPGQKVVIDGKPYTTPARVNLSRGRNHEVVFPGGLKVPIGAHFAGNPKWLYNSMWMPAGVLPGAYAGSTVYPGSKKRSEQVLALCTGISVALLPVALADLVDLLTGASFDLEPDRLSYKDGKVWDLKKGKVIAESEDKGER